jgi:putative SOS response-associated peptidase YedK
MEGKIIYFQPKDQEIMWSASIFEESKIESGLLRSFAAITDEPPPEVVAAGHDRCPVFLAKENFERWLTPKEAPEKLVKLLTSVVPTYFEHKAA